MFVLNIHKHFILSLYKGSLWNQMIIRPKSDKCCHMNNCINVHSMQKDCFTEQNFGSLSKRLQLNANMHYLQKVTNHFVKIVFGL